MEIDEVQERCFQQLTLQNRPRDAEQRLIRKHNGTFGNGFHVAFEFHSSQVVQKFLLKQRLVVAAREGTQVPDVFFGKAVFIEIADGAAQATGIRLPVRLSPISNSRRPS